MRILHRNPTVLPERRAATKTTLRLCRVTIQDWNHVRAWPGRRAAGLKRQAVGAGLGTGAGVRGR